MRTNTIAADEPRYLIRAVVRLTGIPAATLRSWERRYGFPSPERTDTGRRLYSKRDVEAIRWVKTNLAQGASIGQALQWYRSGHSGEAATGSIEQTNGSFEHSAPHSVDPGGSLGALVQQILGAVTTYDEVGLEAALSAAFSLHPPDRVLIEVLVPVLDQIGERWAQGQLTVTAEHFASNVFRRRLFNLLGQQPVRTPGPTVALACVPGEEHELGLLMLAVFLRWAGLHPLYLGANVPLSDLLACLRQTRAAVLCLSAVNTAAAPALAEAAKQVMRTNMKLMVFAGGRASAEASLPSEVHIIDGDLRDVAEAIAGAVRAWTA